MQDLSHSRKMLCKDIPLCSSSSGWEVPHGALSLRRILEDSRSVDSRTETHPVEQQGFLLSMMRRTDTQQQHKRALCSSLTYSTGSRRSVTFKTHQKTTVYSLSDKVSHALDDSSTPPGQVYLAIARFIDKLFEPLRQAWDVVVYVAITWYNNQAEWYSLLSPLLHFFRKRALLNLVGYDGGIAPCFGLLCTVWCVCRRTSWDVCVCEKCVFVELRGHSLTGLVG